jgi:hypothetical protein
LDKRTNDNIKKLKSFFVRLILKKEMEVEDSCPICLESIIEENKVKSECNHMFCKTCLEIALENKDNCPMCRTILQPPKEVKELCERLFNEGYDNEENEKEEFTEDNKPRTYVENGETYIYFPTSGLKAKYAGQRRIPGSMYTVISLSINGG